MNGYDAVDLVTDEAPDLLITDLWMNGMDGYELCQRIREVSTMPVPLLTSQIVDGQLMANAAAAGAILVTNEVSIVPELLADVNNLLGE